MIRHPIGAPGSIARMLDDRAHDPNAEPLAGPWVVCYYAREGPAIAHTAATETAALEWVADRAGAWVDQFLVTNARSYGGRVAE